MSRLGADGALLSRTDTDGDIAVVAGANGPEVVRRGPDQPRP
jgi:hypothetical protein